MQRRAAAIYFAFFLVIGVGAYGYTTVVDAQQPSIDIEGETYEDGDAITRGGQTYVVSIGDPETDEETGETVVSGKLSWTNDSARSSAALANDSTVTVDNRTWRVAIENESDVSSFTLREERNVSAILANDTNVEDETVERGGEPHVVFRANDTIRPLSAYLPAPATTTYSVGETLAYPTDDGVQDATVSDVTPAEATLTWTASSQESAVLEEGANVTVGDTSYVVHFPDENTVKLGEVSSQYENYQAGVDRQDYFRERKAGIWGVAIVSLMAAVILLGAAYLPVKD
jgi:hypothetical protein